MVTSDMLCLANSPKENARCIAGIDLATRRFVRPVAAGGQFRINGRPTLLRGKHDACVFPLTPEAVQAAVDEQLKAREQASQESQQKAEARKAAVDKIVAEKFGGNAELGKLVTADDEEQLNAQADAIVTQFKATNPDFGGTGKEGGDTPTEQPSQADPSPMLGVSDGVAKFAKGIKLPNGKASDTAPAQKPAEKPEPETEGGDDK